MKAYWIALYTKIQNTDNLKKYAELVTPIIKSYGGIPLIRGGTYKVLSGDDFPRTVVWQFPSFDKANECYNSKEYQTLTKNDKYVFEKSKSRPKTMRLLSV